MVDDYETNIELDGEIIESSSDEDIEPEEPE